MNKFKTFLVFLISFILQVTLFAKIDIFGANINIIIPAIIAVSQSQGGKVGGYSGLITGLIEDFLFANIIGIRALAYFLIGYMVENRLVSLSKDKSTGIILSFLASIFNFLFVSLVYFIFGIKTGFSDYIGLPIFIESIVNSLIFLIYYPIVRKIMYIPTYRI